MAKTCEKKIFVTRPEICKHFLLLLFSVSLTGITKPHTCCLWCSAALCLLSLLLLGLFFRPRPGWEGRVGYTKLPLVAWADRSAPFSLNICATNSLSHFCVTETWELFKLCYLSEIKTHYILDSSLVFSCWLNPEGMYMYS